MDREPAMRAQQRPGMCRQEGLPTNGARLHFSLVPVTERLQCTEKERTVGWGWSKMRLPHRAASGARHDGDRSVAQTDGMPRPEGWRGTLNVSGGMKMG